MNSTQRINEKSKQINGILSKQLFKLLTAEGFIACQWLLYAQNNFLRFDCHFYVSKILSGVLFRCLKRKTNGKNTLSEEERISFYCSTKVARQYSNDTVNPSSSSFSRSPHQNYSSMKSMEKRGQNLLIGVRVMHAILTIFGRDA